MIEIPNFIFQNQNKALIEELKSLKELYTGKGYEASPVSTIQINFLCNFNLFMKIKMKMKLAF